MSCGQLALERAGIKVDEYYASEIDEHAIRVTMKNYPKTIQLGDVAKIVGSNFNPLDLLIGGSPCQGFSIAGKQENFDDPKSKLFFEFVRILIFSKPKYFLLENVSMKQKYQDVISKYLGVKPIRINSNTVSAQNRLRLYWTNIPFTQQNEINKNTIKNILEDIPFTKSYTIQKLDKHKSNSGLICVGGLNKIKKWGSGVNVLQRQFSQGERVYSVDGKSPTLSAQSGGTAGVGNALITKDGMHYRKLATVECERLQTLPDRYTEGVSRHQRHKMIGNGWTIDVVANIFRGLPEMLRNKDNKKIKGKQNESISRRNM